MMTYTEEELKAWFSAMKKRYLYSRMYDDLEMVEDLMFNALFESDTLKAFKKAMEEG